MATLSIPHSFVAGTPALASEVNANFQAVVSWTQGQISTDNLGILGARSVALPSSPTFAILSLSQTSSNIALNISNSGTESALAISQSGALANGKGAILINSPSNQTTSGAAELLMTLNTNSSIPAILIKHGAVETLSSTKDDLDLFASAVEISAARLKLPVRTTAQRNVISQEGSILYNTTLKNIAYYDGTSWKPPVIVDNSTLEYSATEVVRVKDLGITTTKIADLNVTTAKIADLNITTAKIADQNVTPVKRSPGGFTRNYLNFNTTVVSANKQLFSTLTLTTSAPNKVVCVSLSMVEDGAYWGGGGNAKFYLMASGPGLGNQNVASAWGDGYGPGGIGPNHPIIGFIQLPQAGTYTFTLNISTNPGGYNVYIYGGYFTVAELG